MPVDPNQTTFVPIDEAPRLIIRCSHCEAEISPTADILHHDDEPHCTDCVGFCEGCEETILAGDLSLAHNGDTYTRNANPSHRCENCRWDCADCNNTFYGDDVSVNDRDERICHRCMENYYCCDDCGCTVHSDNTRGTEDATYCESCYDSHREEDEEDEEQEESRGPIFGHDYKPPPRVLKAATDAATASFFMGWELEVDRTEARKPARHVATDASLPDALYCKHDGSLKHGFEIVSHPGTLAYWNEFDYSFCDRLVADGMRSYDTMTCGLHVHVSRSFLTEAEQFKLLLFFRDNPEFVIRLSRRHGQKAGYDRDELSLMKSYASIDQAPSRVHLMRSVQNRRKRYYHDPGRYTAINLENEKTIEFRLFRGTLNPASLKRNLHLVHMLCHYVKACGRYKSDLTVKAFLKWCRYNGAKHLGKENHQALYAWIKIAVKRQTEADTGR